jgi:poly(3-hydroxybutyrate) depolymerase
MSVRSVIFGASSSTLLLAATFAGAPPAVAAERLPSFNIDLGGTTVSGLSSGGFMAVQFHVAFSGTVRGAGVVAGGPYSCAEGQLLNALNRCMQTGLGPPDPDRLLSIARGLARDGRIDPLENLADDRAYLFTGTNDRTVAGAVVDAARRFYLSAGLPAANLAYRSDTPAGHAMVTEAFGSACSRTAPPYINDCDLDLAGAILGQLYPGLRPPTTTARLGGTLVAFDQTEFFRAAVASVPGPGPGPGPVPGFGLGPTPVPMAAPAPPLTQTPPSGSFGAPPFPGIPMMVVPQPAAPTVPSVPDAPAMPGTGATFVWGWPWPWPWPWPSPSAGSPLGLNDTGFAYVPAGCAGPGEACRVHVVFHGCKQTVDDVQEQYVRNTGYNRWADSNNVVVLYPQARSEPQGNPNGCWDWWGYSGAEYATRAGPQIAAVRAMLDRLAGR